MAQPDLGLPVNMLEWNNLKIFVTVLRPSRYLSSLCCIVTR